MSEKKVLLPPTWFLEGYIQTVKLTSKRKEKGKKPNIFRILLFTGRGAKSVVAGRGGRRQKQWKNPNH